VNFDLDTINMFLSPRSRIELSFPATIDVSFGQN